MTAPVIARSCCKRQEVCMYRNFNSPLFAPIWHSLNLFAPLAEIPSLSMLNATLSVEGINFVPQSTDPAESYEARIFLRGEVETRHNNWHDFFNAVVWHRFSSIKRVINKLHFHLQMQRYPQKMRSPAENMLTIFDECGAIIVSRNRGLLELLRARNWHELFWQRREELRAELSILIFGHAIYEKALTPYIGLCAHALLCHGDVVDIEDNVARFLGEKGNDLRTKDLSPVPILGFPGFWPGNEDESFYFNTKYFMPARMERAID